jgi:hypothetical protein
LATVLVFGLPILARRLVLGAYVLVGGLTLAIWLGALPGRPPAPGVEVGRFLAPMIEEGDRVVAAGLWELELRHGLAAAHSELRTKSLSAVAVETFPRSQAMHPGWFDRDAFTSPELLQEAWRLRERAEAEQSRIWLVWSPALPLERAFFPAFIGWRRVPQVASAIIVVDLLVPPPREMPSEVDEEVVP